MGNSEKDFQKLLKDIRGKADDFTLPPIGRKRRHPLRIFLLIFFCSQFLMILFPPFRYPVAGRVTSRFSIRKKPDVMHVLSVELHKAIDLAAASGTRIVPSAPGVVSKIGYSEMGGNYVLMKHLFGFSTYYAHLDSVSAKNSSLRVFRARGIGRIGTTGRSTGPHVHFEIRFLDVPLPPRLFLFYHDIRRAILPF